MQTSTEKITAAFAPEIKFNLQPRASRRRHQNEGSQEMSPPATFLPALAGLFKQRGVPHSALHD